MANWPSANHTTSRCRPMSQFGCGCEDDFSFSKCATLNAYSQMCCCAGRIACLTGDGVTPCAIGCCGKYCYNGDKKLASQEAVVAPANDMAR